jgi:FkbM family methyltransferase
MLSRYNIRSIVFEPVDKNYEVLVRNLQLNNLDKSIKAFNLGLGQEEKWVSFKYNQLNTGASHIDRDNNGDGCKVLLRTFDSFLTELNIGIEENILFKLDVEGMETEVLEGSANFIRQYQNITYILEEKLTGRDKIKTILDKLGNFEYGTVDQYNMYARKN